MKQIPHEHSATCQGFRACVRARRAELDITQVDLGKRSGLDRSYISGIERSQHNPTLQVIERVAKGLNTKLSILLASAERITKEAE
jgi:transcriptional regulator with XRE-family HTH domain